jgi:hypothetical protein
MLPNFLLIGAARCGTTSLYEILRSHTGVFLPPSKRPEPHFFFKHAEYQKGLRYYENRYFPRETRAIAIGEASTSYIFGPHVPERIAQAVPHIKSILMLRNPIERAFSGYWHSVKSGIENLSFEDAIDHEQERNNEQTSGLAIEIQPFAYAARSDYHEQISRWCSYFPKESLHIVVLDDFLIKPESVLQGLAEFLGIDAEKYGSKVPLKLNPSWPQEAEMSTQVKQKLRKRFESGIKHLSEFMHRDMSFWLR